ncbi:YigZ family protein [Neisseria sp. Ec49-e6-T10]|uniref:YigZ family protein n=1 Tax=Neisseria sp. Ec49-e6-T10 TaxID=3140744 RepID=UPI003EBC0729
MTINQSYNIPTQSVLFEEEIKKSRFITYLAHVQDVAQAKHYIQEIKQLHPQARHHCWAYIAGAPTDSQVLGCSDDGEPAGTAGKPILAQIMGSGLGQVIAVVVRYYGGVLLGTGGLVKAYGHGVQQALKLLQTKLYTPQIAYQLVCEYAQIKTVESIIAQNLGTIEQVDYGQLILMHIMLPQEAVEQVQKQLQNCSKGQLTLIKTDSL